MVTLMQVGELGAYEACAQQANSKGYCCATIAAFEMIFGVGIPPGAPQSFDYEGTTITVATVGAGVPPGAFEVS